MTAGAELAPADAPGRRNRDVAWHRFATEEYLADNYTRLHDLDRRIITALSPYYAALSPRTLASSLDIGTGPNLYPLMLAAAASRRLCVLEHSARNVAYLRRVREEGAESSWAPFWRLCRGLDPALPDDLDAVLRRVRVRHGSAFDLAPARPRVRSGWRGHQLVSMFFVAESVTGDREEFEQLSRCFAAAAAPGGHLVAAYMAGMPHYRLGGQTLPSYPLDRAGLEAVMRPITEDLRVEQLPADEELPYEHEGVLLLTARATARV